MSKKFSIGIASRYYDIEVDDNFAKYFEDSLREDLNLEGNNEVKTLLYAYMKKSHELYKYELKAKELVDKLS